MMIRQIIIILFRDFFSFKMQSVQVNKIFNELILFFYESFVPQLRKKIEHLKRQQFNRVSQLAQVVEFLLISVVYVVRYKLKSYQAQMLTFFGRWSCLMHSLPFQLVSEHTLTLLNPSSFQVFEFSIELGDNNSSKNNINQLKDLLALN